MDTEQIVAELQDLPPDLPDPVDRFEQIHERVRRTRRRQTLVGAAVGTAALALAVPLATQLLPETAEVGPGAGGTDGTGVVDTVTTPVTNESDLQPGGTLVTHLSERLTVTGTGTGTVELGPRPAGATGVAMVLDCLSAGEFRFPDGAGMACEGSDAGRQSVSDEDYAAASYVIDLAQGTEEIEIRTATEGARWRLTTTYVSTELTDWGVNAKGETYGVENVNGSPDLTAVIATNGQTGYAYGADLAAAHGPEPTSPDHALEMQEERAGQSVSVPVYESDGETVVGEFVIDFATGSDEATVTAP